jgi:hypothetical protein
VTGEVIQRVARNAYKRLRQEINRNPRLMIRDEAAIALLAQFIDEDLIMYGDGSQCPQGVIHAGEPQPTIQSVCQETPPEGQQRLSG